MVRGVGCREVRWVGKMLMLGKLPVLAEARDPRKAGIWTVFSIQQCGKQMQWAVNQLCWNQDKKEKYALYPLIKVHSQIWTNGKSESRFYNQTAWLWSRMPPNLLHAIVNPQKPTRQQCGGRTVKNTVTYRIMVMQGHRTHNYLCLLIISMSYSACAV